MNRLVPAKGSAVGPEWARALYIDSGLIGGLICWPGLKHLPLLVSLAVL